MEKDVCGKLIIIGGKEDKEKDKAILKYVAQGVGEGKLCIVSVASSVSEELWELYQEVFTDLGVKHLTHLDVVHRKEAVDHNALEAIEGSTAIFFTGGDQLKITSELGGTVVLEKILDIYNNGGIIAGTSAGASVMGETMMTTGKSDASFRIGTAIRLAPGLGLATGMIIDQHFAERGRIGRLLGAVAHNPRYLGIGIDEDTAIILDDEVGFEVIGTGAVYVLDAHESSGNNISEAEEDSPLSIFNVKLHLLVHGDHFDIVKKAPDKPETSSIVRESHVHPPNQNLS